MAVKGGKIPIGPYKEAIGDGLTSEEDCTLQQMPS